MASLSEEEVIDHFRPWIDELARKVAYIPRGARISSWYRNQWDNRRVGGSSESQHLVGLALDVAPPAPLAWQSWWRDRGLVVVNEWDHTHLQLFPAGALSAAGIDFSRLP